MKNEEIFDIMRSGVEYGSETPGFDKFNDALSRCSDNRMIYNTSVMTREERHRFLSENIGMRIGKDSFINPPFNCDLGFNMKIGDNVIINYGCSFVDCAEISIGDNVMIGPCVKLITVNHPLDHTKRRSDGATGEPVCIENDCWIGSGAIILPGITVGERSVVGAGAVVTKNVPPDTLVVGNPAHVIRNL